MPSTVPVVVEVTSVTARASPKSASLTRPSVASSTFSGLMSRCTRPTRCAAASASSTLSPMRSASPTVSAPRSPMCRRRFAAVDVLHRQVAGLAVDALVVHADEAGVREPGGGAGLAPEPGDEVGAGRALGEVGVHDLQRDVPVQAPVDGQVHGRHAAAGDAGHDLVPAVDQAADERIGDGGSHAQGVYGRDAADAAGAASAEARHVRLDVGDVAPGVREHAVALHRRRALVVAGDRGGQVGGVADERAQDGDARGDVVVRVRPG